jgi:hypothetical protein
LKMKDFSFKFSKLTKITLLCKFWDPQHFENPSFPPKIHD